MRKSVIGTAVFLSFMLVSNTFMLQAQKKSVLNPRGWFAKESVENIENLTFEQAKGAEIGGLAAQEIKKYYNGIIPLFLHKNQALVSLVRGEEVLKVTYPASEFFAPMQSVLLEDAGDLFRPLLQTMNSGYFRLLVATHYDTTGSNEFIEKITAERASAIKAWLLDNGLSDSSVLIFPLGAEMPMYDNDSFEHRNKNRRLTFYLVPNDVMIKKAKKNKLN